VWKGRLTRQELGWLLTQEARGAAERLRMGVQVLRTNAPPPPTEAEAGTLDASLDALDDVMSLLGTLHQRAPRGRRGRIDLAALLWEVAPEARVAIEPGSGTEVFGEEAELRRMLNVLVGHGAGVGSQVNIRRDGDEVRVGVVLGPDSSATAETERAWLARMAVRYGGRLELEGGMEVLSLPADGVSERNEREALRKELDEARKQGEAYARELAAVFAQGEEATTSSYPPMPAARSTDRFEGLVRLAGGIATELRSLLAPLARDVEALKGVLPSGSRGSGTSEVVDERVESIRQHMARANDFVAALGSVGELDPEELPIQLDLDELVGTVTRQLATRAEKAEVELSVERSKHDGSTPTVRGAPRATALMIREVVLHAIASTPRGGRVVVRVSAPEAESEGARVVVDDAGPPLPASARRSFLSLEGDPGAHGRASNVPLHIGAEIAATHGARMELSDAPLGGLRVVVTFARA
jgi:signal transduction histidine kinase